MILYIGLSDGKDGGRFGEHILRAPLPSGLSASFLDFGFLLSRLLYALI